MPSKSIVKIPVLLIYPNAFEETYRGVSGYIYSTSKMPKPEIDIQIKDALATAAKTVRMDRTHRH